mmetsp:Transcript_110914/g.345691  ORF Transcript_110914/g.345691 Transcript_110914/m.345691 type:complete len:181 (+) Transcript_110914:75-617(+)
MSLASAGEGCGLETWWAEMSAIICFLLGAALFNSRVVQNRIMQLLWQRSAVASSPLPSAGDSASITHDAIPAMKVAGPDWTEGMDDAAAEELSAPEMLELIRRGVLPCSAAPPDLVGEVARCALRQQPLTPVLCSALVRALAHASLHAEVRELCQKALAAGVELDEEAEDLYDAALGKDL